MKIVKLKHEFDKFTLNVENIEFLENSIIGLIGRNGAGKTTLMNCITGNQKINGKYMNIGMDFDDILYIPSDLNAYEFLTVNEFLNLLIENNTTNVSIDYLLDILNLKDKENELICNLSQGMSKKVSIAPIFIRNYKLLILDEPFNSIDINYIYELKLHLKNISKKSIILISSHILDTLNDLCSYFYVLNSGKITKKFDNNMDIKKLESEIINEYI